MTENQPALSQLTDAFLERSNEVEDNQPAQTVEELPQNCQGEDCPFCTGEGCFTHHDKPCECDTAERHMGPFFPTEPAPAPGVDHSHPTDPHVRFGVVLPSDAPAPGGAMKCAECEDTGIVSDNGPGQHSALREYVACDCRAEQPADRAPGGADHKDCMRYGCQYGHETGAWPHRVCPEGECQHARRNAEPADRAAGETPRTDALEQSAGYVVHGADHGMAMELCRELEREARRFRGLLSRCETHVNHAAKHDESASQLLTELLHATA